MGKWWQENQQAITVGVMGIAIGGMAIATVLSAGAAAPLLAATIATTLGTTAATGATLATLALAGVATAGGVSIATGAMSIGSTIPSENNVLKPVVNSPTFQVVQGGSILVSTLGTAALAPYAQMGQQAKQEQAATNNTKPAAGQVSEGGSDALQALSRQSVDDKLTRYLLNADHPVGGSKAKWFKEALGYTQSNMDDLAKQIVFDPTKAVQTGITEYGTKFNQSISITGANGKVIDVTFAWMKSAEDDVVRLVTSIPTKK